MKLVANPEIPASKEIENEKFSPRRTPETADIV